MKQKIIDCFQIGGRGTIVLVPKITGLRVAKPLLATITCPDGVQFSAVAFKEYLLRRKPVVDETEGYFLRDIKKEEIPEGSHVEISEA